MSSFVKVLRKSENRSAAHGSKRSLRLTQMSSLVALCSVVFNITL